MSIENSEAFEVEKLKNEIQLIKAKRKYQLLKTIGYALAAICFMILVWFGLPLN